MTPFQELLLQELSEFHRAPFLFIGSGVSRRYINSETWEALLQKFCAIIGANYDKLKSGANSLLPETASAIADIFYEAWWNDPQFEHNRTKYAGKVPKKESCLKIEIAEYLQALSNTDVDDTLLQEEISSLAKVVIDGIITTNYDSFLERVFPNFKPYIGQNDLLFSDPQGIGEIYKIHGSCTKPESLVLTASDYQSFNQRNPYLAAKLLTIFTEQPVILLGYRLGDENVQSILESITSCLDEEGLGKLANRLIMVQWNRNATESTITNGHTFSFNGKIVPYKKVECPNYLELFEVLGKLERKISPKLLRHLRERVYELVKTSNPVGTVFVRDIDEDSDLTDADVLIGVGALATYNKGAEAEAREMSLRGYETYNQTQIIQEYINNVSASTNTGHCQKLIEGTLPNLLKTVTHIPIFRYLRCAGFLDENGCLIEKSIDVKVTDAFTSLSKLIGQPEKTPYVSKDDLANLPTNKELFAVWISEVEPTKIVNNLLYIAKERKNVIDLDALWTFLVANIGLLQINAHKTNYIKCIGLYDYYRYAK